MKKTILVISVLLFVGTGKIKAQTDTLAILQTIITNKANYIGQPFSVLLSQLPLQIRYFSPARGLAYNRNAEQSTWFSFYFPNNIDQLNLTLPTLIISWEPVLNRSNSASLFSQSKGAWSSAISTHYSSAVVSDIILVKRE